MTLNPKPKKQLAISLRLKMKLPRMPLGMPNPSVTAAKAWGEQGSHMAFKDAYGRVPDSGVAGFCLSKSWG